MAYAVYDPIMQSVIRRKRFASHTARSELRYNASHVKPLALPSLKNRRISMKSNLKFKLSLSLSLCILTMSACGKSKLTEDQKAEFAQVLEASGRAETSTKSSGESRSAPTQGSATSTPTVTPQSNSSSVLATASSFNFALQAAVSSPQVASESQDQKSAAMANRLSDAIGKSECKYQNNSKNSDSASFSLSNNTTGLAFSLDGDKCPVKMSLEMKSSNDALAGKSKTTFRTEYQVLAEDFKKLNDVDSQKMEGDLSST